MWWGEGVAREKADIGNLPPNKCECQPVALWRVRESAPSYGTLMVPTRFWPVQNVLALDPMLYEATNPFYYDFQC